MKWPVILSGTVCLAVGFSFGGLLGERPRAVAPAPVETVAYAAPGLTRGEVARVVRAELADAPVAAPIAPRPEAAPVVEPDAEQLERVERAGVVLDQGLARGVWTEQDAEALRDQVATLPAELAMPIMQRMHQAVNSGALELQSMPL